MLAPLLTTALLAATLPATAEDWKWRDEENYRGWRPDTLNWASDLHPQSPSPLILMATTPPPPREMWCVDDANPTPADLDIYDDLLEEWLHDYLDIPDEDPIPLFYMNIPEEC